ncbi:MAG: matrixin family metalloprotease [Candidatus Rokubacteria bacterium]|nr:matrixin family metalloprotease [Candidatus Rokubacteria bacterium]
MHTYGAPVAAVILVGLCVLYAGPATATTVVPLSDERLARDAVAIAIGEVAAIDTYWDAPRRQIFTVIRLAIGEWLKGDLATPQVTLRLPGGSLGGARAWIEGSPEFRRGERVLVFLGTNADGTLRVAHLYQGKLAIVTDPTSGDDYVYRDVSPRGVNVLAATRGVPAALRPLAEVRSLIRSVAGTSAGRRPAPAAPVAEAVVAADTVSESREAYTYLGSPSRWFEPDAGQPIPVRMNPSGEPAAPGGGFDAVRAGYNAWNGVTSSAARVWDGGATSAAGFQFDGVSAVSFGDPLGQIDPPSSCSGTLALTGYYRTDETRVVDGTTFYRIVEGDVVFADGWAGCGFYESYANLAEVATHELGHVLGLGHSGDAGAIMYAFAHFDGRGATLAADDIAGVSSMYPVSSATLSVVRAGTGAGSVTSSPSGIACGSDCSETYTSGTAVTLSASPASGSTFAGWSGGGCTGAGTCTVTTTASTSVTATFDTATTAGFTASFSNPSSDGRTVNGNLSVGMSTTAPWGQSKTWLLAVDGTTVTTVTNTGTVLWYTLDTRTVANGLRTLTVSVTYNGQMATASRTINVANGTSALTAAFSSPAAGATVSGTQTVGMSSAGGASGSRTFRLEQIAGTTTTLLSTQTVTGTSASYGWNTTAVADGSVTLRLTVTDSAGVSVTVTRAVTVSNSTLTASFTSPAAGATVSGTQTVGMASAGGASGSRTFRLEQIVGTTTTLLSAQTVTGTSASYSWNTTTVANGTVTLRLTVTDSAGASVTVTRSVTVSNGTSTAGFTVSFSNPTTDGRTVTGNLSVGLSTTAPWGQAKTWTLSVDGATLTTVTNTGTVLWYTLDSRPLANGARTLRATVTYNGQTAPADRTINVAN